MRAKLFFLLLFVGSVSLQAQRPVKVSTVFASEKQNRSAAQIPELLLDAYRSGHIRAYYPKQPSVAIPYAQFLAHYGMNEAAQDALGKPPAWFCTEVSLPGIDRDLLSGLSEKFEIVEELAENRVTRMNEWRQQYIRLVYSETCHPAALRTMGPVFKVTDLSRLTQTQYSVSNPANDAARLSIADIIRLRLYKARTPKK